MILSPISLLQVEMPSVVMLSGRTQETARSLLVVWLGSTKIETLSLRRAQTNKECWLPEVLCLVNDDRCVLTACRVNAYYQLLPETDSPQVRAVVVGERLRGQCSQLRSCFGRGCFALLKLDKCLLARNGSKQLFGREDLRCSPTARLHGSLRQAEVRNKETAMADP